MRLTLRRSVGCSSCALGLWLLAACSAELGATASQGEGAPLGPNSADPGASAAPGTPTAGPVASIAPPSGTNNCGEATDPGFVALRRLTRVEYDNTVRDLLGDTSKPSAAFPNDDSILAENSVVSALFFEKHEGAVERMVDEAWARELAGQQPQHAQLGVCDLASGGAGCASQILRAFAERAWRRPVLKSELAPQEGLVNLALSWGDSLDVGVRLGLKAILNAPEFVFRVELDPGPGSRPLTDPELAVRLSYLLWSSTPDQRLLTLAGQGQLSSAATLAGEMTRMLADPKAAAFIEGFSGHWLSTGTLRSSQPEPTLSGGFDEALREAMATETIEVFREFVNGGLPFTNIVDADFSFLNLRLAQQYGVELPLSNLPEAALRKVPLAPGPRRGLLTHGGILTMTSGPTTTSPVKRGKFVLAQLLCTAPPPPPPGADELSPEAHEAKTERERLELHRANPTCAACHSLMDPIGLGFENFDFVGRYRQDYADGTPIDPSGDLPGGVAFATFEELRSVLKADPRVLACVADKLFTYAVGRQPSSADQCAVQSLTQSFAASGRFVDLLSALSGSPPFIQRRPEGATP